MKKDELGERMKGYEMVTRSFIPRRTYIIIRLDGKSFSKYTKKLEKPFDMDLSVAMEEATKFLVENIQGAKFGYTQSDEISILITDFENPKAGAWYDNNVQKMCSISSSLCTGKFVQKRIEQQIRKENLTKVNHIMNLIDQFNLAQFDSRVYSIPNPVEVANYFIWRQNDCTRNSVSMAAQALYSPNALHGKDRAAKMDMMMKEGVNWNNYDARFKRGLFIEKTVFYKARYVNTFYDQTTTEDKAIAANPDYVKRTKWKAVDMPVFTKDPEFLASKIPLYNGFVYEGTDKE